MQDPLAFAAAAFVHGHFEASVPSAESLSAGDQAEPSDGDGAAGAAAAAASSVFPMFDVIIRVAQTAATEWVRFPEEDSGGDDGSVHTFIGRRLEALLRQQAEERH